MPDNMTDIDGFLRGSIDMHVHPGPVASPTRFDAMELAEQALQAGMRGLVLKDSGYPTAPLATIIKKRVPGVEVIGSITLNFNYGGLNHHAVEASAQLGARVLWMPTYSSLNSISKFRAMGVPFEGEGISLLDSSGQLVPEVEPILSIVKRYDMVLATGHISPVEIIALTDAAFSMGIRKVIITHPFDEEVVEKVPTVEELKRLAGLGAYIEHTFVFHLPTESSRNPEHTVKSIREIGAEHCIISTDLGLFTYNPSPVEGFRLFIATLIRNGVSPKDIELMARTNPAALLDIK